MKKNHENDFKIRDALDEHTDAGFVMLQLAGFKGKHIVSITNKENNKKIWCEAIEFGHHFCKKYNSKKRGKKIKEADNTIVINKWYGDKLDIETSDEDKEIALSIELTGKVGALKAALTHANTLVRLATQIAIVFVVLGVVGAFITLWV